MPETPATESAPESGATSELAATEPETSAETASEPAPQTAPVTTGERPAATSRLARWARWIAVAALVMALLAAAGAGYAWYHPRSSSPKYSEQDTAQAKKGVCGAYAIVQRAVVVNTHMAPPNPNDAGGRLGVEANARLALLGGGAYLRDRITAEPAAPAELSKVLTATAREIEQLGMNYMAGASSEAQEPLKHDLDAKIGKIKELCT